MTSTIPQVDYRRTALRPTWAELPDEVHHLVEQLCGARVADAGEPAGGGFTSGYAGLVRLVDDRAVFVKAGGPANDHVVPAYRLEAELLPRLPAGIPAPALLATGEIALGDGPWRVLVTQPIAGRMPGQPWTEPDLASVHRACLLSAELLTPAPAELSLPSLADEMTGDAQVMSHFGRLAEGSVQLTWGQPAWTLTRAGELAAIIDSVAAALHGYTATHSDVRADNLLIDAADQAWLLDWNWLCTGPAWTDFVGVLPLARADGLDPQTWLDRSPLTRDVDPAAIDAWLAIIAAYMLENSERPGWPGAPPALRVHQRRYARTFLDWLGARRGWC